MFHIIQYLYDNYLSDDRYPDDEDLAVKLAAIGFDQGEIRQALDWLDGLTSLDPERAGSLDHAGLRIYSEPEKARLSAEGRGFLAFMEQSGVLKPYAREWVVERALALNEREVPAEKIKWITMLAMWRLGGPVEAFWLEDLIRDEDGESPPTLH